MIASGWYPEKIAKKADERLRFYADRFPVVENDAAYYALPDPKQAQLWVERTPDGFTMDFKAFYGITELPPQELIDQAKGPWADYFRNRS